MTPATLALMTAVGPPDCATNTFPTNSVIVSNKVLRAPRTRPVQNTRCLTQSSCHLANRKNRCQKDFPECRKLQIPRSKFQKIPSLRRPDFAPWVGRFVEVG